jgi:hypothetical protein
MVVGSEGFGEQVKTEFGVRSQRRQVSVADSLFVEPPYGDHFYRKMKLQGQITPSPGRQTLKPAKA